MPVRGALSTRSGAEARKKTAVISILDTLRSAKNTPEGEEDTGRSQARTTQNLQRRKTNRRYIYSKPNAYINRGVIVPGP